MRFYRPLANREPLGNLARCAPVGHELCYLVLARTRGPPRPRAVERLRSRSKRRTWPNAPIPRYVSSASSCRPATSSAQPLSSGQPNAPNASTALVASPDRSIAQCCARCYACIEEKKIRRCRPVLVRLRIARQECTRALYLVVLTARGHVVEQPKRKVRRAERRHRAVSESASRCLLLAICVEREQRPCDVADALLFAACKRPLREPRVVVAGEEFIVTGDEPDAHAEARGGDLRRHSAAFIRQALVVESPSRARGRQASIGRSHSYV